MNVFLSQLKNTPWVYNDLVVDVDGEALTVGSLIERYKVLKKALADVQSMTKKESESSAKPSTKTKTKAKPEKSDAHQSSIE